MKRWWIGDLIGLAIAIVLLLAVGWGLERLPFQGMAYYNRIVITVGINVILAVSLNIINGHAGQFSMGHAGFMAIGAYVSAFLTYYYAAPFLETYPEGAAKFLIQNLLFLGALLIGGAVAALAGWGVGVPSLRLRGDYLAIVTLGFGEIIRVLILNIDKVGAARGLSGVPVWTNFFWVFFFAWITILVSKRIVASSVGRAFLAVREDEIAAQSMGVNTTHYKVQAFVIGAFFAGVSGGLMGHYLAYLNPAMFQFILSFEVIVMVVLGGMGSITGTVIAAVFLTWAKEWLRLVKDWFSLDADPRMIIYSVILILMMRFRPQGLLGHRELWHFWKKRKDSVRPGEAAETDESEGPPIHGGSK